MGFGGDGVIWGTTEKKPLTMVDGRKGIEVDECAVTRKTVNARKSTTGKKIERE